MPPLSLSPEDLRVWGAFLGEVEHASDHVMAAGGLPTAEHHAHVEGLVEDVGLPPGDQLDPRPAVGAGEQGLDFVCVGHVSCHAACVGEGALVTTRRRTDGSFCNTRGSGAAACRATREPCGQVFPAFDGLVASIKAQRDAAIAGQPSVVRPLVGRGRLEFNFYNTSTALRFGQNARSSRHLRAERLARDEPSFPFSSDHGYAPVLALEALARRPAEGYMSVRFMTCQHLQVVGRRKVNPQKSRRFS